jgi:hypothetical protein
MYNIITWPEIVNCFSRKNMKLLSEFDFQRSIDCTANLGFKASSE